MSQHISDSRQDWPEEVFPPTDSHLATLAGEFIYIIGCLGYSNARLSGETPRRRLRCESLSIEKVETSGDKPGWSNAHQAAHQLSTVAGGEIRIWGGKIWEVAEDEAAYFDNQGTYVLNLNTLSWRLLKPDRFPGTCKVSYAQRNGESGFV